MRRTIVGLALVGALALLAAGANFGCSQNTADPIGSGGTSQQPGTSGTVSAHGGCPCGK